MFATILRDVRHAIRALRRTPGFSTSAVLTFALGIGVNTAVFSVFNGVLPAATAVSGGRSHHHGLDGQPPARTSARTSPPIRTTVTGGTRARRTGTSPPITSNAFTLTGADEPERLNGAQATANFFDVMGVQPLLGRLFTEAQQTPGLDAVAVLSHGLWQRRFGGAPNVLGRTIVLNGRSARDRRRDARHAARARPTQSCGRRWRPSPHVARRGDRSGCR